MLPRSSGGDARLVHQWDELNIIVQGACSFRTDKEVIEVKEGTIMFVREGNGHFFNSLKSNTDILILWDR